MVGVDIGCGMRPPSWTEKLLDLEGLDRFIVPTSRGMEIREHPHAYQAQGRFAALRCFGQINEHRARHHRHPWAAATTSSRWTGTTRHAVSCHPRAAVTWAPRWPAGIRRRATAPLSGNSRRQLQELMEALKARRAASRRRACPAGGQKRPAGAVAPDLTTWRGPSTTTLRHGSSPSTCLP